MTIEEEFFKCFGVDNCSNCDRKNSLECYYCDNKYPEITAEILLNLICVISESGQGNITLEIKAKNIDDLKTRILKQAINRPYYVLDEYKYKQQVKSLFEEGAEDE